MEANAQGGTKVICLGSGQTYNLSIDTAAGDDDTAAEDDLDISADITIEGNGSTIQRDLSLTCNNDGTNQVGEFRIFEVHPGAKLTLKDVTVRNGCADGLAAGGGIWNAGGTLTLERSTISDNSSSNNGGGITNSHGGTLTINNSTISGNSTQYGGGIENSGTLTVTNSTISGNRAKNDGGGIDNYSGGTLTVTNSTISGNSASFGGGIYNGGTLIVESSTVSANSASSTGGGIYATGPAGTGGTVTITNSTISGNTAGSGGGIASAIGTVTITNITMSGNRANFAGGGILTFAGTVNASFVTIANNTANSQSGGIVNGSSGTFNIKNSIVAGNTAGASPRNCGIAGTFQPSGVNFADDGTCTGFTQVTSAALNLQPLGNYGGPTQTHALGAGSVAIDSVTDCTDLSSNPVSIDQRGVSRPQGSRCDAGAYEYQAVSTTYTLSISPTPTGGKVTSNPGSIDCGSGGSTCSNSFTSGTTVQLTATPDTGYVFTGWTGDCSSCGTNTTCSITMSGAKTCSANFSASTGVLE
ncbi:choice-of-anchor Q domain-containing protein [Hydrogenobacter thermophilus]|uniref:choice-of-anchor Q domain-containing protein n=1 Tax=Hydrogenobacter thermophilus TaxID=940 RepID=UPI0026F20C7C|nr:choice-of-anchor Q domain-containing protein [Hydrogenobacter thermophilus]